MPNLSFPQRRRWPCLYLCSSVSSLAAGKMAEEQASFAATPCWGQRTARWRTHSLHGRTWPAARRQSPAATRLISPLPECAQAMVMVPQPHATSPSSRGRRDVSCCCSSTGAPPPPPRPCGRPARSSRSARATSRSEVGRGK